MNLILLKFNPSNKVINQWSTDHQPEPGLFDATGRSDGPDYMGRTYSSGTDTFSPRITVSQTRREELKAKAVWTAIDRDDAIRELL